MEDEVLATEAFGFSAIATRILRATLLVLVWVPFLGSNYLTLTHLTTWLKKGYWPAYSTANLLSDLRIAHSAGVPVGAQTYVEWIMAEPAAYLLMGLAIILSLTIALIPDGFGSALSLRRTSQ